jgi:hypothetical protein
VFFKLILAGIMIAIAAFVFLQLGDWYGAVAFAVGLVAIMEHKFILFTG